LVVDITANINSTTAKAQTGFGYVDFLLNQRIFWFKPVWLQSIFEGASDVYRQEIEETGMKVTMHIVQTQPLISYSAFLKIIVDNLLENAIRFRNPQQPHVQLEVTEEKNGVTIMVKDNGIGIEKIYIDKVFEMFFRGSELSKGNGLGLYIVKKAVEKLKGNIKIDSTTNQGTTFLVWIPFQQT
jgi:signal transduction histidine kinase